MTSFENLMKFSVE